eukprot:1158843-Pelagomonas_calceolata.AAC.20
MQPLKVVDALLDRGGVRPMKAWHGTHVAHSLPAPWPASGSKLSPTYLRQDEARGCAVFVQPTPRPLALKIPLALKTLKIESLALLTCGSLTHPAWQNKAHEHVDSAQPTPCLPLGLPQA